MNELLGDIVFSEWISFYPIIVESINMKPRQSLEDGAMLNEKDLCENEFCLLKNPKPINHLKPMDHKNAPI